MRTLVILTTLLLLAPPLRAQQERQLIDLRGTWKFEIGDRKEYASPSFNDAKWGEIFVPADWENEGFPGYDGYAWYRRSVTLPSKLPADPLYLHLGNVDDACMVYVNGTLIGEGGRMPPQYETAYSVDQRFPLPVHLLKPGERNVIAVRVYDDQLNGGIVRGRIGIFEHQWGIRPLVALPGLWKFKKGDNEQWKDPALDDRGWESMLVPAPWDIQGYRDYDGFGWYRVSFDAPASLSNEELVLMLGRIDDIDEAYLNGERIGRTGRIRADGSVARIREEYRQFRGYPIPSGLLKPGQKNVIAVRVFDNFKIGGIYDGPVGIVRRKDHRIWNERYEDGSSFQRFMDRLFPE